ncbi:MAG: histidine phosphatase family protein [Nocardioides sp.]
MSPSPARTTVHVVRHGEVDNPEGVLYGRSPGFHLSPLGRRMAERVAEHLATRQVVLVTASPLERAQETALPIATAHQAETGTDPRLIESENSFAGRAFGPGDHPLRDPASWRLLWNPFRPSWGEPYAEIAERMRAAIWAARDAARGAEAVLVSHQLPIWIARLSAEGRSFLHDPRRRECTLASITSFHFVGPRLIRVGYEEPALGLIPERDREAPFSAGGAPEEHRP